MNRIFTYLERFYTKAKRKNSLSMNGMNLYKDIFFDHLEEEDIYKGLNKLIKQDRNCNIESKTKTKIIFKILNDN